MEIIIITRDRNIFQVLAYLHEVFMIIKKKWIKMNKVTKASRKNINSYLYCNKKIFFFASYYLYLFIHLSSISNNTERKRESIREIQFYFIFFFYWLENAKKNSFRDALTDLLASKFTIKKTTNWLLVDSYLYIHKKHIYALIANFVSLINKCFKTKRGDFPLE